MFSIGPPAEGTYVQTQPKSSVKSILSWEPHIEPPPPGPAEGTLVTSIVLTFCMSVVDMGTHIGWFLSAARKKFSLTSIG